MCFLNKSYYYFNIFVPAYVQQTVQLAFSPQYSKLLLSSGEAVYVGSGQLTEFDSPKALRKVSCY